MVGRKAKNLKIASCYESTLLPNVLSPFSQSTVHNYRSSSCSVPEVLSGSLVQWVFRGSVLGQNTKTKPSCEETKGIHEYASCRRKLTKIMLKPRKTPFNQLMLYFSDSGDYRGETQPFGKR